MSIVILGYPLLYKQNVKNNPVATTEPSCIGPDGKKIRLTQKACEEFNNAWKNKPQEESAQDPSQQLDYQIVDRSENNTVENYKVLVNSGTDGKAVAMEVKKQCKQPCNIDIYDDMQALKLQKEYDEMMKTLNTQPEELQSWKKKNYAFVADHLIGYLMFDISEYQEYPYKDWYYKELTGN